MLDFHFWIWSSFRLLPGEKVLTQGKKEKFQKIKKTCSKLVSFRFFRLSNFYSHSWVNFLSTVIEYIEINVREVNQNVVFFSIFDFHTGGFIRTAEKTQRNLS